MWTDLVLVFAVLSISVSCNDPVTSKPRWLGEILQDTDLSLSSILSEPADPDRVQFALQFVLGYKGLMERLRDSARTRDPRTIEVFRQLKTRGFRPMFMDQLPKLSMRQDELRWTNEDMDTLRTAILEINKLIDQFKTAVTKMTS